MKVDFGSVSERDMDLLFLYAFGSDKDFLQIFLGKLALSRSDYEVKEIILSKSDKDGESDITVVIEADGQRIGLLIEDKIDAVDMPDQPERYLKRGETDVRNSVYQTFYSFIVLPDKYYISNEAVSRYPFAVMYEEIRDYFKEKIGTQNTLYYQQISQAIEKAKKPPKVEIDENANRFFRKYADYQEERYPQLNLRTKRDCNGYWAHYATRFGSVYLYHKIGDGNVDLTFNKAAGYMDKLDVVADWLRHHGIDGVSAVVTGKAGALRIRVPKLNMQIPFEENDEYDVDVCFHTISELIDAVNVFGLASEISDL
jgi:hypothetical protein